MSNTFTSRVLDYLDANEYEPRYLDEDVVAGSVVTLGGDVVDIDPEDFDGFLIEEVG